MTDSELTTVHLEFHELPGVSEIPSLGEVELLPRDASGVRVFLTKDRTPHHLHLRRVAALGMVQSNMISFPGETRVRPVSYQQEFQNIFPRVRINDDGTQNGAMMVTEVRGLLNEPDLQHLQNYDEFDARILLFENESLKTLAMDATRLAHAGVTIALGDNATYILKSVGCASYVVEKDTNRPIYSLNMEMSVSFSILTNLTSDNVANIQKIVKSLVQNNSLENIVRLLSISADADTDQLSAFLAAWTSLELLIQKTFTAHYEPLTFKNFSQSMPESSVFVDRIQTIMKNKYNIRDKFSLLASMLGDASAKDDINTFIKIKKQRDELAHTMKGYATKLPTNETRKLARKYLELHLQYQDISPSHSSSDNKSIY